MTDLRKAAEMALEALNKIVRVNAMDYEYKKWAEEAHEALRQALAQPEQEPVAWIGFDKDGDRSIAFEQKTLHEDDYPITSPLYIAPPKREWVGLTDEEGAEIWGDAHDLDWKRTVTPKKIVKRIEAKLKEKNT